MTRFSFKELKNCSQSAIINNIILKRSYGNISKPPHLILIF